MGGNCESRSQNQRFCRRDVNCVKALAEIFDFVAGLMQRVPKKTNAVKSDLQNSTAKLPRKKRFEGERIYFKEVYDIYLHLL